MTLQLHYTGTNNSAYLDALEIAERRAPHSYFNQHIIAERDDRFIAIDEGDYNALPAHLATRHGADRLGAGPTPVGARRSERAPSGTNLTDRADRPGSFTESWRSPEYLLADSPLT